MSLNSHFLWCVSGENSQQETGPEILQYYVTDVLQKFPSKGELENDDVIRVNLLFLSHT